MLDPSNVHSKMSLIHSGMIVLLSLLLRDLGRQEFLQAILDDINALREVFLRDHQRWCQTNYIFVGGLSQKPPALQEKAELPCCPSIGL